MPPVEWFYARFDQQYGPVSAAELKRLADTRALLPDDLVWRDGMDDWAEARQVKKLFERRPSAEPAAAAPPLQGPTVQPSTPGGAVPVSRTMSVSAGMSGSMPVPPPAVGGSGAMAEVRQQPPVQGMPAPQAAPPVQTPLGPPPTSPPADGSPWMQPKEARTPRMVLSRHPFDAVLEFLRPHCGVSLVDSMAKIFAVLGHFGLYAGMVAGMVFPVVVEASSLAALFFGMVWVLALLVVQYVAERFIAVLRRLNRQTSGSLSSTAFSDSLAVLAMVVGLGAVVISAMLAVQNARYTLVVPGLLVFFIAEHAALVALAPASLNLQIAPRTESGEEAIGVFTFLVKVFARTVPVAFGAGVLYGAIMLVVACYQVSSVEPPVAEGPVTARADSLPNESAPKPVLDAKSPPAKPEAASFFASYKGPLARRLAVEQSAIRAMQSIFLFAILPFAAYLLFLIYYLSIDVLRAVLALPGKLDTLAQHGEKPTGPTQEREPEGQTPESENPEKPVDREKEQVAAADKPDGSDKPLGDVATSDGGPR